MKVNKLVFPTSLFSLLLTFTYWKSSIALDTFSSILQWLWLLCPYRNFHYSHIQLYLILPPILQTSLSESTVPQDTPLNTRARVFQMKIRSSFFSAQRTKRLPCLQSQNKAYKATNLLSPIPHHTHTPGSILTYHLLTCNTTYSFIFKLCCLFFPNRMSVPHV